jgi:hypothetical protein
LKGEQEAGRKVLKGEEEAGHEAGREIAAG